MACCEFSGHGLADDHGACFAQRMNAGGIDRRLPSLEKGASHLGRQIEGLNHIFDRHRAAVEEGPWLAFLVSRGRRICVGAGAVQPLRDKSTHVGVALIDHRNAAF